jgi:hypothetical protein
MEKKDALVKCSGCGTPYKLKIPVTDKPLRFQCKKCGKVLNIRIKAAPEQVPPPQPEESAPSDGLIPEFETTQLPDSMDDQEQATVAPVGRQPSFTDSADQSFPSAMVDRRWLVLSNEQVKGPFTDDEVSGMIKAGEIGPDTSLRMGQRPWIRANQVPWFRDLFGPDQQSSEAPRATERDRDREEPTGMPFYEELGKIVPYPLRAGNWQPLAIFLGIALVIFAALAFEFIIGLPLSIIGWTVLYGYLTVLMKASTESPGVPPPAWDFSNVKNLLGNGIKVLLVLLVCCMIPTGISLLLMIAFFLNGMEMIGYVLMLITVAIYAATLFAVPAGLVILAKTQSLGSALSPSRLLALMKKGDKPYLMLAVISVVTGLVCMFVVLAALFLVELSDLAFVAVGLLMAVVFTYMHFVWFHVLGRYFGENSQRVSEVLASGPSSQSD